MSSQGFYNLKKFDTLEQLFGQLGVALQIRRVTKVEKMSELCAELLMSPDAFTASGAASNDSLKWLAQHQTRYLDFFLASITERWLPRIVVLSRAQEIRGAVLLKERRLGGISSGLLYGDSTLGSMLLSPHQEREAMLEAALGYLLDAPGVRGIRLAVPPAGYEANSIRTICQARQIVATSQSCVNHLALALPDDYEEFLRGLGSKTRRNFRYYRRRAEALGHEYVDRMSWPEFRSAVNLLPTSDVTGSSAEGLKRALKMFSTVDHPVYAGLRTREGRWLAVLGGWQEAERTVLFLQINAENDHPSASLSTVLRAHFIENLIIRRVRKLLFWGGVGLPLSRYCVPIPTQRFYLDSPSLGWRATRSVVRWCAPFLPKKVSSLAQWIAPISSRMDG